MVRYCSLYNCLPDLHTVIRIKKENAGKVTLKIDWGESFTFYH